MPRQFQIPASVGWRDVDDRVVVVDVATGSYFVLEDVAAAAWRAIVAERSSTERFVAWLLDTYQVSDGEARADVEALVQQFLDAGLVVTVG